MDKAKILKMASLAFAIAAVSVLTMTDWFSWSDGASGTEHRLTARATTGPLVVSVVEFGEIESEKRTIIANELQWPVIITSVVDEGTLVNKGRVIIELECKQLIEAIETQDLRLDAARLAYTQAEKNLNITKKEAVSKNRKAENAVTRAEENLQRYKDKGGWWEVQKDQAESNIKLAEQKLKLAEEKLSFKLKVNQDKTLKSPYSQNEIEAEQLKVKQLKLAYEKTLSNKEMLIKYDHPQKLRKFKDDVEQARSDRDRTKLAMDLKINNAERQLKARKRELEKLQKIMEELKEQKGKLIVRAEQDGLVIYESDWSRGKQIEVKPGEKVRPRAKLIKIPDMTSLHVKTEILDSLGSKIRVTTPKEKGTECRITLDCIPGKTIIGHVRQIAPLPKKSGPHFMQTQTKVYDVIISVDWKTSGLVPGKDLKPGMSADVELILSRTDNVLTVPVAALYSRGEDYYCWKLENDRPVETHVTVGIMNDSRIQILSGLDEGDEVLLTFEEPQAGEETNGEPSISDLAEKKPIPVPDPDAGAGAGPETGGDPKAGTKPRSGAGGRSGGKPRAGSGAGRSGTKPSGGSRK